MGPTCANVLVTVPLALVVVAAAVYLPMGAHDFLYNYVPVEAVSVLGRQIPLFEFRYPLFFIQEYLCAGLIFATAALAWYPDMAPRKRAYFALCLFVCAGVSLYTSASFDAYQCSGTDCDASVEAAGLDPNFVVNFVVSLALAIIAAGIACFTGLAVRGAARLEAARQTARRRGGGSQRDRSSINDAFAASGGPAGAKHDSDVVEGSGLIFSLPSAILVILMIGVAANALYWHAQMFSRSTNAWIRSPCSVDTKDGIAYVFNVFGYFEALSVLLMTATTLLAIMAAFLFGGPIVRVKSRGLRLGVVFGLLFCAALDLMLVWKFPNSNPNFCGIEVTTIVSYGLGTGEAVLWQMALINTGGLLVIVAVGLCVNMRAAKVGSRGPAPRPLGLLVVNGDGGSTARTGQGGAAGSGADKTTSRLAMTAVVLFVAIAVVAITAVFLIVLLQYQCQGSTFLCWRTYDYWVPRAWLHGALIVVAAAGGLMLTLSNALTARMWLLLASMFGSGVAVSQVALSIDKEVVAGVQTLIMVLNVVGLVAISLSAYATVRARGPAGASRNSGYARVNVNGDTDRLLFGDSEDSDNDDRYENTGGADAAGANRFTLGGGLDLQTGSRNSGLMGDIDEAEANAALQAVLSGEA